MVERKDPSRFVVVGGDEADSVRAAESDFRILEDSINLLLIGRAEKIDLLQPAMRAMVDNEGIYLCGDTASPAYTVPVASIGGRLYSMTLDDELDPARFKETVTVAGPFHKLAVPPNP